MKQYCVYIMSNIKDSVLYIGVTSNLPRRINEHKSKKVEGFTKKYNCIKLVHFEQTENVMSALEREKQLKKWNREKKDRLIDRENPQRIDLYESISQ